MSAESISLIAGSILSLFFSYMPGLNARFAGLSAEIKRLIMLGLLVLVSAGVYGLACTSFGAQFGVAVTCDQEGLVALLGSLLLAVIANQTTYTITPKTGAVQEARSDAKFEALSE